MLCWMNHKLESILLEEISITTYIHAYYKGFPGNSAGKESAFNARDPGSICGSGRSPGEGIGYPI